MASARVSFDIPKVGISSSILVPVCFWWSPPVCTEKGFVNVGSKLSSWFPAITILCLCGKLPENIYNIYNLISALLIFKSTNLKMII